MQDGVILEVLKLVYSIVNDLVNLNCNIEKPIALYFTSHVFYRSIIALKRRLHDSQETLFLSDLISLELSSIITLFTALPTFII